MKQELFYLNNIGHIKTVPLFKKGDEIEIWMNEIEPTIVIAAHDVYPSHIRGGAYVEGVVKGAVKKEVRYAA